ncbi:Reverse transcriptase domain-containing protein [Fusarium falciforme]|uniref:Reverse transcriptase domain-containing protein n=1 Tax=Fusarium falciforme TaxID=195108 RepID=UPI002301899A|nr:Reverse transcriptase domain-containing protein [Fusarium falciforme]WAO89012.1 Reverse transcriptase domain-containing protein [Fusarium falciforme]
MKCASELGVTFSPEKYNLMHFKRPYSRGPDCALIPKIPGFSKKPEAHLRILGVEVDKGLRWEEHIQERKSKVKAEMNHLLRISGSIWGPKLKTMKQLYVTKIRPIITYACGSWFIPIHKEVNWGISQKRLGILESLQYQCLLQISGAMRGTSRIVLEKELNIDSIRVTLCRLAATHRAKMIDTPDHDALVKARTSLSKPDDDRAHPYTLLDLGGRHLRQRTWKGMVAELGEAKAAANWSDPKERNKALKAYCMGDTFRGSEAMWDEYRQKRAQKHATVPPAMKGPWGADAFLRCYSDLPRAQTSILLQCRTGVIGLNDYLFSIKQVDSPQCPCGKGRHTAFHLFTQCERLRGPRAALTEKVGHNDFYRLLIEQPKAASDWAITHFDLNQYVWPRENGPSDVAEE